MISIPGSKDKPFKNRFLRSLNIDQKVTINLQ